MTTSDDLRLASLGIFGKRVPVSLDYMFLDLFAALRQSSSELTDKCSEPEAMRTLRRLGLGLFLPSGHLTLTSDGV